MEPKCQLTSLHQGDIPGWLDGDSAGELSSGNGDRRRRKKDWLQDSELAHGLGTIVVKLFTDVFYEGT